MVAITADIAVEPAEKISGAREGRIEPAPAIYLMAGRFPSPGGMAFLPQSWIPSPTRKPG